MRISENDQKMLEMIASEKTFRMTNQQIAEQLELQPSSVQALLRRLEKQKKIKRIYKITNMGTERILKLWRTKYES